MKILISTRKRRLGWAILIFLFTATTSILVTMQSDLSFSLTGEQLMNRMLVAPILVAAAAFILFGLFINPPAVTAASMVAAIPEATAAKPFMAQVVGVQWLNPLQRRDYPTEWQLLWTLGIVRPNKNDDMVRTEPHSFSSLQSIGAMVWANNGEETFDGFHDRYVYMMALFFRQNYFSNEEYFYTVKSKDKSRWRELAGIHIEYALPGGKLDPSKAADALRKVLIDTYEIGNQYSPSVWTRSTPPDVRVTQGGPNAGFTSLAAGLDYLQAHPKETVWVMNWDAPSFPKDGRINENMVLLVLAGPDFDTEREPLAWLGYPASGNVADFQAEKGKPSRAVQAWKATLDAAARNVGKVDTDVGYVVHDADNTSPAAGERIGRLAEMLTTELPEFDFVKQTFNTPALLGEMGAGTALTDVALGIAYANHFGKSVLVAGTTDAERPTAVVVVPPAKVRPIRPGEAWFRARGENYAYLPWWGSRRDAPANEQQGYSE